MSSASEPVGQHPVPNMQVERSRRPRLSGTLKTLLAAAWVIGFLLFFYTFDLPNNPYNRVSIWIDLPELLAANLVSPDDPTGAEASSGWKNFSQRLDLVLVAGVILAGAWGLGSLLLRFLASGIGCLNAAERMFFAFALGLSGLSLFTLGSGLAGFLSRSFFVGFVGACPVLELSLRLLGRIRGGQRATAGEPGQDARATQRASVSFALVAGSVVAAAPFLLAMLLASMLPSTDFDTREYHLQGPKEFYRAGRVGFLEHNVYTSFPFLTEMLSLLAMVVRGDWFRGALSGKAVLMTFAPLTAVGLYAAGRRYFSPAAGWVAAVVFLTTPWTYRMATGFAFAEGGLSFFLFSALFGLGIAIEQVRAGLPALRLFLLCGLMAGSAMACKYTGLVQVVIPMGIAACAVPFFAPKAARSRLSSSVRIGIAFSLGVLLAVGPWLVKNAVETGNPVYPLAYSVFGGRDWSPEMDAKWQHAHTAHDQRGLAFWIVDVMARNDWLSPLLYGFAPLALLVAGWRRRAGWLWLYAMFLFFAWWGFTHRLDRFWIPLIPVVAFLAGAGTVWCGHRFWKIVATTAVALAVLFNLAIVTSSLGGFNAYLADLDEARLAAEETAPAIAFLNRRLSPDSKVLLVGEAQVFDARFLLAYNTVFDVSLFEKWCAADASDTSPPERPLAETETIRARFAQHGITHVLVNWNEILRYRTTYGYTPFVTPERFADLQRMGVLSPSVVVDFGSVDLLDKNLRAEIDAWGAGLKTDIGGQAAFRAIEVFRVLE